MCEKHFGCHGGMELLHGRVLWVFRCWCAVCFTLLYPTVSAIEFHTIFTSMFTLILDCMYRGHRMGHIRDRISCRGSTRKHDLQCQLLLASFRAVYTTLHNTRNPSSRAPSPHTPTNRPLTGTSSFYRAAMMCSFLSGLLRRRGVLHTKADGRISEKQRG